MQPPDRVSFNTAIAALSRGGQWRKALELLDEMPRVVAPPRNTPDAHSFGAAISACERGGQPDVALGLFHRMQVRKRSKAFALTWYRALTWYFLRLSSLRTYFEPWKAVGTRGRGSLAAR